MCSDGSISIRTFRFHLSNFTAAQGTPKATFCATELTSIRMESKWLKAAWKQLQVGSYIHELLLVTNLFAHIDVN